MNDKREKRLNSEFQKEIYNILKNKVKDPDICEMFSISEVDVTNDLKHAKVYVSIFSGSDASKKRTFDAICAAAKTVRGELGRVMRIRTVPELHFMPDTSTEYGMKIDKILSTLTYSDNMPDDEDI